MDKATVELLAHRAGLAKALAEFPEDVAAAAKQAALAKQPAVKQASSPPIATCLTKEYLDGGAVKFSDTCTGEWAQRP